MSAVAMPVGLSDMGWLSRAFGLEQVEDRTRRTTEVSVRLEETIERLEATTKELQDYLVVKQANKSRRT